MSVKKEKYNINSNYLAGCRFDNWIRLLWQNKFRIKFSSIPKALYITLVSLVMFIPAMLEKLIFGKKIKNTVIDKPPVFILGHWRSGTTFIFNVMAQDKRFGYFDSVSVFTHHYFLLLGKLLRKITAKALPSKRPMDNIVYDSYVPQEELYAYATEIPESIIHMAAFPQNAAYYRKMAFTKNMTPKQYRRFCKAYSGIIKKTTFALGGKRMLLKSPDNTAHADALLEMYPDAKFIHIYRNPYKVIVSTIGLFKKLFPMFSLQGFPDDDFVEDFIFDLYAEVHEQYIKDKEMIPPENLIEIAYEEFVKSPIDSLEMIYDKLKIGSFEEVRPEFENYLDSIADYQTNKFKTDERLQAKITQKLGKYIEYFGYEKIN